MGFVFFFFSSSFSSSSCVSLRKQGHHALPFSLRLGFAGAAGEVPEGGVAVAPAFSGVAPSGVASSAGAGAERDGDGRAQVKPDHIA